MQITFDTSNATDLKQMRQLIDALLPSKKEDVVVDFSKRTKKATSKEVEEPAEPKKPARKTKSQAKKQAPVDDVEDLRVELRAMLKDKAKTNRKEIKAFLDELGVPSVTKMTDLDHFDQFKSFLSELDA